jgi:hypothetical protein
MKNLPKILPYARRLSLVSIAQVVLFKTHKDLEVQFDILWASTPKPSSTPETIKASTSKGCERCYNVDIDALCAQSQHSNIEQVIVESCDEAIGKDNDSLKLKVKRLEQKVKILEKQVKANHLKITVEIW